ncbi:hypothetical protein GUB10_06010 [Salegentibacter sp. BLCTC]|uniref:hypothetical protein n=1 Tax=Salegentibacter sp. BLCTC TaxID=2697368 RepID=UPI00187BB532|nr:hypothetical protein [Salegentibacter sp. BLCTC]MBE7639880.1 hypothetical protein [Salegentibacter sp. BLCTC]
MDRYNITARVYPMILFYLPLSVLIIFLAWDFEKYYQFGIPAGLIGLLTYLTAQLGRDSGKKKEPALWSGWGGAPTTQLFRWRNNVIDKHTKKRNHEKMQNLCPVEFELNQNFERDNPKEADEVYTSWSKFLIGNTRDTKKFSLLFKENIAYGFRRNLWGLKLYAVILIILLMIACYFYFVFLSGKYNILHFPGVFWVAESFLSFFLLFWLIIVRKSWVSVAAYSYAERLHEALNRL